jgi:hypothetical protein
MFSEPYGTGTRQKCLEGKKKLEQEYAEAMLRTHDILVWIRIRGSMPMTNHGSGSWYFRH